MKREKKRQQKKKKPVKVSPNRNYPVRMETITSKKTGIYKEKMKTIFEIEK